MKNLILIVVAFIFGTTSLFALNFSQGKPVENNPIVTKLQLNFTIENYQQVIQTNKETESNDVMDALAKKLRDDRYKINDLREFVFINPSIIYKE